MFKANIMAIVLCAFSYMSFGTIYIYGDVLSRRLFGGTHSKNLEIFIKLFLILFILLPGLGISIAVNVIYSGTLLGEYGSYLILIGYNLAASALILFLTRGIFEALEMH